ncbi:MAG: hypothetical protein Alpg2KO_13630 [Alphaproteobacteria bacterium]
MTREEYLLTRPFDAALAITFFAFLSARALITGEIHLSHSRDLHDAATYTLAETPTDFWILFSLFAGLTVASVLYLVWRLRRRKQAMLATDSTSDDD